jgi:dynein assembly factor 5
MVNSLHDLLEVSNVLLPGAGSILHFANQKIFQRLQPSLSILQNPDSIDRTAKRLAIRNLREIGLNQLKDSETAREFLQNTHSILLACIRGDRVEKCREQCLEFTYDVFSNSSDTGFALEATLELCKKRVLVTAKMREPEEEAEEIRLGIVRLLNLILSKSSANDIKPAIADDVLQVIQGCITDRFPDVQKEACAVLLTITERKSSYLGYFGDKITKALLPILRHKHAVLRTLGIQVAK